MILKETRNSYFCVTPKIRRFMSLHHFPSIQKILTKDIIQWLELITEILSFLQTFTFNIAQNLQENQQNNYIFDIFWTFKKKLQTIHAST